MTDLSTRTAVLVLDHLDENAKSKLLALPDCESIVIWLGAPGQLTTELKAWWMERIESMDGRPPRTLFIGDQSPDAGFTSDFISELAATRLGVVIDVEVHDSQVGGFFSRMRTRRLRSRLQRMAAKNPNLKVQE